LSPSTFGLLAIPALHIASRNPDSLFIQHKSLLNRKGHMYAAKWLWNRLMTGPEYNLSKAVLSEDAYFCPSAGCPYFRTVTNRHSCQVITEEEWQRSTRTNSSANGVSKKQSKRREAIKQHLILVITVIVVSAFISVTFFGTIFYRNSLKATKPRFEATPGV
uniref:MSC domain-containing protein n=1 Tax=Anisakis simplex TaxID=6269 RepID=A0A0M3K4G4_ANISI